MSSSAVHCGSNHFTSLAKEDTMAEKNRKKTYLIVIAVLIVVVLITFL
jgi:hypothetical protein